ncbi:Resolvase domain protein, partial [mine drainage metagenome]
KHGYSMMRLVSEVGSALNGHRRKFLGVKDPNVTTILVEHRDRFCRFGADYVRQHLVLSQEVSLSGWLW